VTAPGAAGPGSTGVRLAAIGLLAAGVAVAPYAAGRLHTPNYTTSLSGSAGLDAAALKSTLSSIALGLAGLQVLLALWIDRKLPLAGRPPRPVRLAHRVIGFGLAALTVPIAVHCLLAYRVTVCSGAAPVNESYLLSVIVDVHDIQQATFGEPLREAVAAVRQLYARLRHRPAQLR
jgi:hypothetical protein